MSDERLKQNNNSEKNNKHKLLPAVYKMSHTHKKKLFVKWTKASVRQLKDQLKLKQNSIRAEVSLDSIKQDRHLQETLNWVFQPLTC